MVRPIDPDILQPGMRLAKGLYTRYGVKLLSSGVMLTDQMCKALAEAEHRELYLADSPAQLLSSALSLQTQNALGQRATSDLVTAGGMVVLQAGEEIEQHHIDAYALGAYAPADPRELRRQWAAWMRIADAVVEERARRWEPALDIDSDPRRGIDLTARGASGWPAPAGLTRFREERVELFRRIFARLLAGMSVKVADVWSLIDELVSKLVKYPERFTQIALLTPRETDYLPDHCYTTAVLSVAISARLGWAREHVRMAGAAGLLADIGMGLVPRDIRASNKPLSDVEINRVRRHPAFSVMLLEELQGLPEPVRQAVYQHHERELGIGYPLGLKTGRICQIAKVVAVADAFSAATEPRSYRVPKRPYDALEEMIQLGAEKMYDRRTVRALVESTGLFPVGSFVRLSTGEDAAVIGCHPESIDRPIVAVERGGEIELCDLTQFTPWDLSVIQAIERPGGQFEGFLMAG